MSNDETGCVRISKTGSDGLCIEARIPLVNPLDFSHHLPEIQQAVEEVRRLAASPATAQLKAALAGKQVTSRRGDAVGTPA